MPSTDWMWRARLGAWALLLDSPRMHPNAFSLSHGAPGPPGQEHPAPPPCPQCTSAPWPSTALRLWRGSFALWCPGWGTQGRSWAPAAGKGLESRDRVPARPSQVSEQEVHPQGRACLCSERGGWGLALGWRGAGQGRNPQVAWLPFTHGPCFLTNHPVWGSTRMKCVGSEDLGHALHLTCGSEALHLDSKS